MSTDNILKILTGQLEKVKCNKEIWCLSFLNQFRKVSHISILNSNLLLIMTFTKFKKKFKCKLNDVNTLYNII